MKKLFAGLIVLLSFMFLIGVSAVFAAKVKDAPTQDEVKAFVDKALAYAKTQGKEAALKTFTDQKGPFVRGELYIFAYDFSGTVIAHGGQPALVGKNLINLQDIHGIRVIQGLRRIAEAGGGWLEYSWPNPAHKGAIETKLGYVQKVDDTWFLGSGTYLPTKAK